MERSTAIESRSTATTTCTSCGTTLSADSNGSIWDAVRELGRLRDARGWLTDHAYGRRWCPGCVADGAHLRALPPMVEVGARDGGLSLNKPASAANALREQGHGPTMKDAPGDQGAPERCWTHQPGDLAET